MKDITELIDIANVAQVKKLMRGGTSRKGGTLVSRLYRLMSQEIGEEEVVVRLYGKGKTVKYAPYRNLKKRLYEILVAAILNDGASTGTFSDYTEANINGYRHLSVARILYAKRAWNAARAVAFTTYRRVKKYQVVALNYELADMLATLNLGAKYNERTFKRYLADAQYYAELRNLQDRVHYHYRLIRNEIYSHRLLPVEIGKLALAYARESEEEVSKYPKVSRLQMMQYTNRLTGLMMVGSYQDALTVSSEAEIILSNCAGVSQQSISIMLLIKIQCTVRMGRFEEGRREIRRAQEILAPSSINAIKVAEYAVTLGLKTGNYDYAYREINQLNWKDVKKQLQASPAEYWLILDAYVNLLVISGRITPKDGSERASRFRLTKFVNNVSSYTRNKQGMNIQIIILQFVYYVVQKKYGKIIDRIDAIERYGSRYLKNNEQLRNNCFFRLLLTAERCQFHRAAVLRKSSRTYQRMISPEAIELSKSINVEILPYEVLWNIVLENLDTKAAHPTRA